jgi:hypothetical protein
MPLNSSLKVLNGWARDVTSGPSRKTWPLPSEASTIAVVPFSAFCPHAQPERSGV